MEIRVSFGKSALLEALKEAGAYKAAVKNGAIKVSAFLKEYYIIKNFDEPNRLGGTRSNFWADVARSVQPATERGDEVIVSILDFRLLQKIYGGKIRAKRVKYLTIPISKEAYNTTARVFERKTKQKLFPIKSKKGNRLLVSSVDGAIQPHYLLKEQVDQKPWPGSLPSDEEILKAFNEGISLFLQQLENDD